MCEWDNECNVENCVQSFTIDCGTPLIVDENELQNTDTIEKRNLNISNNNTNNEINMKTKCQKTDEFLQKKNG